MTTTTITAIEEVFKYRDSIPPLTNYTSVKSLRADYEAQEGPTHWFSPETLAFFGSRNLVLHRPGLMIETQANAPDLVPPVCVTAWVEMNGRITPHKIERFADRKQARAFVEALDNDWPHSY